MAINAGSVFVQLGAKIDRSDFDAYDRELAKVRAKAAQQARFKAELGGDYNPKAFNAYYRDLEKSQRQTDHMVKSHGKLTSALKSGVGLAAAAGGFATLTAAVGGAIKAYGEAEASQKRVETALKNAGISYKAHSKQIDEVIQKQSKLAGLDDEDLADSFGKIVGLTKDVNEALRLNGIAADVARGRQLSLEAASKLVTRAALGNAGALKRLGIEAAPVTAAVDKLKASSDKYTKAQLDQAKAQDLNATKATLIDRLQKQYAGQAEAYGKTQAGAIDRLSVSFENLQETAGRNFAPSITRATNALAKFFDEMSTGEGTGGKFVRAMKLVGVAIKGVADAFVFTVRFIDDFIDKMLGAGTTVLNVVEKIADAGGKLPGRFGKPFRDAAKSIHNVRESLDNAREGFRLVAHPIDDVGTRLRKMAKNGANSLADIRRATRAATKEIKDRLGSDTDAGQRALGKNFRQAEAAIRESMKAGVTSTRSGLAQIQSLMSQELKLYGINPAHINAAPLGKSPGPIHTINRAGGGWIGQPGMAGGDTVPAMLGVGEAVLNRHQQSIIESLLGDGFLDRLFATVDRPHFLARGGRVPGKFASGGLQAPVASLANRLSSQFGLSVTSTTGGTHAPGSYHYRGLAADLGGSSQGMARASSYLMSSGTYRSLLEGIHNPGLSVKNGAQVSPGFWGATTWGNHANHIHIALSSLGKAAMGFGGGIKTPNVVGGGVVGRIVQAALGKAAGAANSRLDSLAAAAGGGDMADLPSGGRSTANRAIGRRMAAAYGWTGPEWAALDKLWTGESGWNERIPNAQGSGAYGIPQALPASKMASAGADWRTNPATQIKWGLGYISGRYGTPSAALNFWLSKSPHWYARGGRVIKAAKGFYSGIGTTAGAFAGQAIGNMAGRSGGSRYLPLPRGWGWEYLPGLSGKPEVVDIYNPNDDFGPAITGRFNKLDVLKARAATTADLFDDLSIAKFQESLAAQLYFSRVARRAPGSKVMAAAQKLTEYRGDVASIFGEIAQRGPSTEDLFGVGAGSDSDLGGGAADPSADLQALLDQANSRLSGVQGNLAAAQRVQQAFSSSGDIGFGGFGNAYQAARMAPRIVINTLHPGDPQTLVAIGNAATAGQSLQSYVPSTRSKVGV